MNPSILTEIPKAQESFAQTIESWSDIDTTDLLLTVNAGIKASVAKGLLCYGIGGIVSVPIAEKAALQLQELGYYTSVNFERTVQKEDGTLVSLSVLMVSWKNMPQNTRDQFTV